VQIYGISDVDLLSHHHLGVQTADEEFNMYSMSHVSPQGTDVLAFWNVSFSY
jgi:hypothetical protein